MSGTAEPLSVAVAQPFGVLHDVAGNAEQHALLIRRADARVVVFPELSLTGYGFDVSPIDPGDARLEPILQACGESGSLALIGAPVAAGNGDVHIAVLAVDEAGASVVYRKMFLGEGEDAFFAPGSEPAAVDVDGWRLGLAVCKDTGVAEHAAITAELGMDVYVAGVCEMAADADVQPQRAHRVIADFGVWVAVASFAGETGGGFDQTAGRSTIWRPDGTAAATVDDCPGNVARAVLTG